MKIIPLSQGKVAIVDDEDYPRLTKYSWCFNSGYARRCTTLPGRKRRGFKMHREILRCTNPIIRIDHINGNQLDNRKGNLRFANAMQNGMNRRPNRSRKTIFKGIHPRPDGRHWRARITYQKRTLAIGDFENERHAAMAYDIWAKELFGKFARPNFVAINN